MTGVLDESTRPELEGGGRLPPARGWVRVLRGLRSASVLTFVVSAGVLCALWEVAVAVGWLRRIIAPPPSEIFASVRYIAENFFGGVAYWTHTWITVREILFGFALSAVLATLLAALSDEFVWVRRLVQPYVVGLNTVPKIAFAPLFVVWFGFGIMPKIVMAAFISFFPIFVNTLAGLRSVDTEQMELMASLHATRRQVFWYLKSRQALPFVFAGLKVAMVLSVIGAVVGEFAGSQAGIGFLIQFSAARLRTADLFAFVLVLSIHGYLLFRLIDLIESRVVFWLGSARAEAGTTVIRP